MQVGDTIQDLADELGSHRLWEVTLRCDPAHNAQNHGTRVVASNIVSVWSALPLLV